MYRGGYAGKVLRVNLTDKTYAEEPLPLEVAQDFLGGSGITVKYVFDEVPPDCDPLGPENKLVYAPGPTTGSGAPHSDSRRFSSSGKAGKKNGDALLIGRRVGFLDLGHDLRKRGPFRYSSAAANAFANITP